MLKGIIFALTACFIWGLIFIVPQFMHGFGSFEIAIGRYACYSLISLPIFIKRRMQGTCDYRRAVWIKALGLSLISSFSYYIFVVLSLRYATPAICALILGVSPITTAFYGNWRQKECSFASLIPTSILILVGLVIINVPPMLASDSPSTYLLGVLSAFLALISWSWYVVANAEFLKRSPEIQSSDWSTVIGMATSFWVVLFAAGFTLFGGEEFQIQKYTSLDTNLIQFILGSMTLGLFCSWIGATLWNKASLYLPISLAGQMTIFETIFGLLFVYALDQHIPPMLECVGIVILFTAIAYGIRQATKNPKQVLHV